VEVWRSTHGAIVSADAAGLGPRGKINADRADRARDRGRASHADGEKTVELGVRHHGEECSVGLRQRDVRRPCELYTLGSERRRCARDTKGGTELAAPHRSRIGAERRSQLESWRDDQLLPQLAKQRIHVADCVVKLHADLVRRVACFRGRCLRHLDGG
jgi:hypothetical protein